jgi:hypothetical protein
VFCFCQVTWMAAGGMAHLTFILMEGSQDIHLNTTPTLGKIQPCFYDGASRVLVITPRNTFNYDYRATWYCLIDIQSSSQHPRAGCLALLLHLSRNERERRRRSSRGGGGSSDTNAGARLVGVVVLAFVF